MATPPLLSDVEDGVRRHRLVAGEYEAVVSEVGAQLIALRHAGRNLVFRDAAAPVPIPDYSGAVLVPWPNRIAGGRYRFGGEHYQLPVNEVERGNAIHGLLVWDGWQASSVTADAVTLTCRLCPRYGYPFPLSVTAAYSLDQEAGLSVAVTSRNDGTRPAPYGVSIHPYLLAGDGLVDAWSLRVDAARVLETDARSGLPLELRSVEGTTSDLRAGRSLDGLVIDTAYTGVAFSAGTARAELTGPDGRGVAVHWDQRCPWVQVYTLDVDVPALRRRAVALEPMTCAPDAFNSGAGPITLEPGAEHSTTWRIAAIAR
jgi:aldose 1-epimerase